MMERRSALDFPRALLEVVRDDQQGCISRRSFLDGAGRFAAGALTAGAIFEVMRPMLGGQQAAKVTQPRPRALSIGSEPASRSRFRSTSPPSSRVSRLPVRRSRAGSRSSKWGRRC